MTTDRWGKETLQVSDVMPNPLTKRNRRPLVDRCKRYVQFFHSRSTSYLDHFESRVGQFTILVYDMETALTDRGVNDEWSGIERWAAAHNVTIT